MELCPSCVFSLEDDTHFVVFIFVEFHRHLKGKEISLWQINIDVAVEVGGGSILISRRSSVSNGTAASRAWSNIPRVISLVRAIHFNEWKPDQLIRERAVEKARGNENAATSAERSIQPAVRRVKISKRSGRMQFFWGFPVGGVHACAKNVKGRRRLSWDYRPIIALTSLIRCLPIRASSNVSQSTRLYSNDASEKLFRARNFDLRDDV